jgi:hypothetical protein
MARIYVGQTDQVAVSAAQDLWAIIATTTPKSVRLLRCVISASDVTIPTSQMIAIQIVLFTGATITAGSGGTTPTAQKVDNGDPSNTGFTLAANNTTGATTTGTTNIVYDGGFHAYNGFDESFVVDGSNARGAMPIFVQSAANAGSILVRVKNAPTGTIHLSSTVWVEEAG